MHQPQVEEGPTQLACPAYFDPSIYYRTGFIIAVGKVNQLLYSVHLKKIANLLQVQSVGSYEFPRLVQICAFFSSSWWLLNCSTKGSTQVDKNVPNQYPKLVSNRSPNSSVPNPHSPFDWEGNKLLKTGFVKHDEESFCDLIDGGSKNYQKAPIQP